MSTKNKAIDILIEQISEWASENEGHIGFSNVDKKLLAILKDNPEALEALSRQPAQLVMSTDYEALYEHLKAGGEALGRYLTYEKGPRPAMLLSPPMPYTEDGMGRMVGFGDLELDNPEVDMRAEFLAECARLKLEWVAPRQPAQTELDPWALAIRFHDTYERLAPSFGYETRKDTRQFDPETPNGKLMVAVCSEIARSLSEPK